ncbi:MAG: hypothetical protein JWN08_2707, partial [Frankiales bacterium]|nr:hypothetical protein [Frankiales bacterium]
QETATPRNTAPDRRGLLLGGGVLALLAAALLAGRARRRTPWTRE